MQELSKINEINKTIRYWILKSTTQAASGHPSSSLSAVEIMSVLMFGGFFKYDIINPSHSNNDKLIFSKGHASALFYALWAAAGGIKYEELLTFREFGSRLEGHPTLKFPYTIAPTGSLGQGLSIGVGTALNDRYLARNNAKTFVLLGDGELEEGQVWEAMQIADKYKLNNLVLLVDMNGIEQAGVTIHQRDSEKIENKLSAFGFDALVVKDGHNIESVYSAYEEKIGKSDRPLAIIFETIKGKGVKIMEDSLKWHGKSLSEYELEEAIKDLGELDENLTLELQLPEEAVSNPIQTNSQEANESNFNKGDFISTRKVIGESLALLRRDNSDIVVLDAGVSNSTFSAEFKKIFPDSFFEMFIAEQNMVSLALGLSRSNKIPYVTTFAAFFTRAFDQIRMASQAKSNIKFIGIHGGISIGQDGQSQMGLEDISMFRALQNSIVLYPSDAVCMKSCIRLASELDGMVYIRATRSETPVIYDQSHKFELGGFHEFLSSIDSREVIATVIGSGITLHEALKAQVSLAQEGTNIQVIDLYSIKPINSDMLKRSIKSQNLIIVEDHFPEGGIGEALFLGLSNSDYKFKHLAVWKEPMSGKPEELLSYAEIDAEAIKRSVLRINDLV